MTLLILPIFAFETEGLFTSIKRSILLMRQLWVEIFTGIFLYWLLLFLIILLFDALYVIVLIILNPRQISSRTWWNLAFEPLATYSTVIGTAILFVLLCSYSFVLYKYTKNIPSKN
jgi:lysylphosphatidylglycerol synthetase-like protein (DUF2156 family)